MATPSGKFYDLDLEVDLGREWAGDRRGDLATSTLGRVSVIVAAAALGLLLGIVVGHLTARRDETAGADWRAGQAPAVAASTAPLTEAERSVRRRLAEVALGEAAQRIRDGLMRSGPARGAVGSTGAPGTPSVAPAALDQPTLAPPAREPAPADAANAPAQDEPRDRAAASDRRERRRDRSERQRASGSLRWDDRTDYDRVIRSVLEIQQTDPYR